MHSRTLATIATFGVTLLAVGACGGGDAGGAPAGPGPGRAAAPAAAARPAGSDGAAAGAAGRGCRRCWRCRGPTGGCSIWARSRPLALAAGAGRGSLPVLVRRGPGRPACWAPGRDWPCRAVLVAVVLVALLPVAARVPEGSPAYQALEDTGLGMRLALGIARAATDGDGDGYSARFGGGDCDDRRADTYPGRRGRAPATASIRTARAATPPAPPRRPPRRRHRGARRRCAGGPARPSRATS